MVMQIHEPVQLYVRNNCPWHKRWIDAFAQGLHVHGVPFRILPSSSYSPSDIAVCWGCNHPWLEEQKAYGRLLILERGFIGDRTQWTAAGWEGINGRADFRNDLPGERLEKMGWTLEDWQYNTDGVILVAGQVAGDNSVKHLKIDVIYRQAISDLLDCTHRKIVFRPHPLSRRDSWKHLGVPLSQIEDPIKDINRAFVTVSINSNFGVDSIVNGVPHICLDVGSMAWEVSGLTALDAVFPYYPDRKTWLKKLAYCQWNTKEMETGLTWAHIGR